jgi:YVTN family beta-propeller protein
MKKLSIIAALAAAAIAAFSCSPEDNPIDPNPNPGGGVVGGIEGFFLINQGQMSANNASLDYYDYATDTYTSDVFDTANPEQMGMGDVANDMELHDGRLYITLTNSNFVAVVDAVTAKLVGNISVSSPRSIAFEGNHAYVTSFAGATYQGTANEPGFVAKVDLATRTVVSQCTVGYQPEELAVVGGKLYVANSGGYQSSHETTVSVIDLATFPAAATETIEVAPNLWRVRPDGTGKLYVSSKGDYNANGPATYIVDTATDEVVKGSDEKPLKVVAADNITLGAGTLYAMFVDYPAPDFKATPTYLTYNLTTGQPGGSFITDESVADITAPYELSVHPASGELLLTDAGDYQRNGILHCYSPAGKHTSAFPAGVVPANIVFVKTKFTPAE